LDRLNDSPDTEAELYTAAWMDMFAEEEEAVELCAPYPSCVRGLQGVEQFVESLTAAHAVHSIARTGPILVSGRSAVFPAVSTDADREKGCLSSRVQLVFLEISEVGPSAGRGRRNGDMIRRRITVRDRQCSSMQKSAENGRD
jgi:hypothetical protein